MDNQHRQITGYRELDAGEIDVMNAVKAAEEYFAVVWRRVLNIPGADARFASIARTHIEEGCSALVRAVARPVSPFDQR